MVSECQCQLEDSTTAADGTSNRVIKFHSKTIGISSSKTVGYLRIDYIGDGTGKK